MPVTTVFGARANTLQEMEEEEKAQNASALQAAQHYIFKHSQNYRAHLVGNPFAQVPSPDRPVDVPRDTDSVMMIQDSPATQKAWPAQSRRLGKGASRRVLYVERCLWPFLGGPILVLASASNRGGWTFPC